jgi:hypothetical protein
MYESIRQSAMADGISISQASVLVGVFKDQSYKEMSDEIKMSELEVKKRLRFLFHRYGVKSKAALIVKCAPYIKGELINNKGVGNERNANS